MNLRLTPSLCLLSDAIGPQGGKVMSTTPFDEAMTKRRSDVTVGFVLVYTLVGYPVRLRLSFELVRPVR